WRFRLTGLSLREGRRGKSDVPDRGGGTIYSRPFAAALLIMLWGPLLGCFAALAWEWLGIGVLVIGYQSFTGTPLLICYELGGIQSTIFAIIVGQLIDRNGWVSLQLWLLLTALFSIVPAIIFYFVITVNLTSDLFIITLEDNLAVFSITTFFA